MKLCSEASRPMMDSEISVLMCSTALSTPLPPYRVLSPSRSSSASREPVEAPDGTAARPMTPDSSNTSASTVGLPRESRVSLATTSTIELICSSVSQHHRSPEPAASARAAGIADVAGGAKRLFDKATALHQRIDVLQ